ncbi:DMT family transporter [Roseovarius sp. LXJ103]|uniref:DMT family transporter n=1 Tax=Roseovarius carneus TaxID=2853164 RepID=UPI0015E7E97D|nr:DMT family transporter [Roseovarius carneus]MBZ8119560.1 DMT family transporter [Roseovarius carneus]
MSLWVFCLVLFAAFLHALWNAIVKGAGDKAVMLGLIAFGHVIFGVVVLIFAGAPGAGAVPYLIASTVIHWAYYALLNTAYRVGDLSVVYPIARGLSPILIAVGAQVWAGEVLPLAAWIGILAVSGGIMALAMQGRAGAMPLVGFAAAGGVALSIASYSLVDGIGVRGAQSVWGYIGWLFVLEGFVVAYVMGTKWARMRALPMRSVALGIFGGVVSSAAYALVLVAKTMAPLGVVSALRETSVIFAALIGVWWFTEGPKRGRIAASVFVGVGIALIAGFEGS